MLLPTHPASSLVPSSVAGLLAVVLPILVTIPLGARIVHVDHSAIGSESGDDWDNAYPDLQTAIVNSMPGDEIWVVEGTYYPDEGQGQIPNQRTSTFTLLNGVAIYGGFSGDEILFTDRNPAERPTILSGDLLQNDLTAANTLDNAHHIITADGTDASAVLDGFRIASGHANSSAPANGGGGLICNGNASPTLINCAFTGLLASDLGGAAYINDHSSPTFTNCSFAGNHATILGGAICITNSSTPSFINCTFADNSATGSSAYGGGIYVSPSSSLTLVNGILWGNSATSDGDQIHGPLAPASSHNIVEGETVGGAVVSSADPNFIRSPDPGPDASWLGPADNDYGDLRLQAGSPAYNLGLNAANPTTHDLSSRSRLQNGLIDLGAHETPFIQTVTTLSDSGEGSLRDAIATIINPGGGTIDFDPGLDGGTITLAGTQILIDKSVTIDGSSLPHGISIDANQTSRVFEITAGHEVQLDTLIITGGRTEDGPNGTDGIDNPPGAGGAGEAGSPSAHGGGILNAGNLTLNRLSLAGNHTGNGGTGGNGGSGTTLGAGGDGAASGSGGGIHNSGILTVVNCTITDNHTGPGGDSGGGSGTSDAGTGGSGGGIYNSGTLSLVHATITDNTIGASGSGNPFPGGSGGGVKQLGTLSLQNSLIAENATITGGPDLDGAVGEQSGVNFIGNPAGTTGAAPGLLTGDPRLGPLGLHGGATPTRPLLFDSPAVDPVGGDTFSRLPTDQRGIDRFVGATVDIGAVEAALTEVVTSAADSGPGTLRNAIGTLENGASITFAPSLDGGVITLTSGELHLEKSVMIDATLLPSGITIDAGHSSRVLMIDDGDDLIFRDITLIGLTVTGGATNENGAGIANRENLTLLGCSIESNTAQGHGGGLWLALGTSELEACSITGNSAMGPGGGGGLRLDPPASVVLLDCAFSENSATNTDLTSEGGGALAAPAGSTLSVTECSFNMDYSATKGGAISLSTATATISTCKFTKHTSEHGGAVSLATSNASFTGCTFLEVQSSSEGGVFYMTDSSAPVVTNCSFMGNSSDFGGASYSDDSNPSFINCLFSGNHAVTSAGATFQTNGADAVYTNCCFSGNHAGTGGAIYSTASTPTLTHCILWNNSATTTDPQISGPVSGSSSGNLIENGSGAHVISTADPNFVRHADPGPDLSWSGLTDNDYGNLLLLDGSPAIGSGSNSAYDAVSPMTIDLLGRPRQVGTIDLGPYEGAYVTFSHLFPLLDPGADANRNGLTNFIDYASGIDPTLPSESTVHPSISVGQLTFPYRPAAADAAPRFQRSSDLSTWKTMLQGIDFTVEGTVINGPQTRITLDLFMGADEAPAEFYRAAYSSAW